MIELTQEQRKAISEGQAIRLREDGLDFVLVRADVFDKLTDYDDSPLTDEEMDRVAKEAGDLLEKYQP